ncbi:hypothetical protein [Erwinia aphidicola]|uniref:hypothetical protein n=1 Tax=Erwinia aphidicola TaxID=68334 RepID=UPI003019E850
MSLSSSLRSKMRNERDAAIALDKALSGVKDNINSTASDVYSGVERLSWYSSCFFEKYKDSCSDLSSSDKRFFLVIGEVYKRADVIGDMIEMYISIELEKAKESIKGRSDIANNNKVRELDVKITALLSYYMSGKAAKNTIAGSVTSLIENSGAFSSNVLNVMNKRSLGIVTDLSMYGKIQKASISAIDLKHKMPSLYYELYKNKLGMLYFLIQPSVDKAIAASNGKSGEDRIISVVRALTKDY